MSGAERDQFFVSNLDLVEEPDDTCRNVLVLQSAIHFSEVESRALQVLWGEITELLLAQDRYMVLLQTTAPQIWELQAGCVDIVCYVLISQ